MVKEPIMSVKIHDKKRNKVIKETLSVKETSYALTRANGLSPNVAYAEVHDIDIEKPVEPKRADFNNVKTGFDFDAYNDSMSDYETSLIDWRRNIQVVRKESLVWDRLGKIKKAVSDYQNLYSEEIKSNMVVLQNKAMGTAMNLLENGSNADKRDMVKTLLKLGVEFREKEENKKNKVIKEVTVDLSESKKGN